MQLSKHDRYSRGAHTVLELKYHFVWKTKYGYPILQGEIGLRLRDLIKQICAENEIEVVRGNVRANHIHVLVSAPSDMSVSHTVGAVTEEMIKRYIEDQSDTPEGFKVWDEKSHAEASGAPAFRPISKPSSLDEGR